MPNKQLTEAQAWRKVARRIAEDRWSRKGLCSEMWVLTAERWIARPSIALWRACRHAELSPDRESCWGAGSSHSPFFAYPPGKEQGARVLAALWMALEAEEEADA